MNEKNEAKPSKNDVCSCGSGVKYKFCCISKEPRPHWVTLEQKCDCCGAALEVDVSKDFGGLMSAFANSTLPLRHFCKDNDFCWFSNGINVGQSIKFLGMLKANELTIGHLMRAYKEGLTKDIALGLLDDAQKLHPAFASRAPVMRDAFEAHFQGKYSLSIPTLFPQIEGFHREYGGLALKQAFAPTISKDMWNARLLPGMTDSAGFFNAYLSKLFQGSQEEGSFNRNPILHGADPDYPSEERSLTLILIVLEIRSFLWFEINTKPVLKEAQRTLGKLAKRS